LQRFTRAARLILVSKLAMPVDHSIQSLLAPADSSFASPVKASAGDGARLEESNGENGERSGSDSDGNAKSGDKPKRPWNGRADYRLVETWDTGENRTQDVEISRNELYLLARKFFEDSKTLKLPTHKSLPTDIHMWKQFRTYKKAKSDAQISIFRCPMKNRCGCLCCIKTIETKDKLQLYFLGEHNEDSHSTDKSAFLKVKQIQAIVDGVK
jgi:hypothetical protein